MEDRGEGLLGEKEGTYKSGVFATYLLFPAYEQLQ